MKLVITRRFKKAFQELPNDLKIKAEKALRLLVENPRHPSLHLKKIKGTAGIWEARIDRSCRMTLEIRTDCFLLRNIGKHDEALNNP